MAKSILLVYLIMTMASCTRDHQKIIILYDWAPNSNHTGLYVADELGFFREEGLDIAILQAPDDGALELLVANRAHLVISSQEVVVQAVSQGLPVKAVATILQHNDSAFASLADKGITRPRDFAGRSYLGWGSTIESKIIGALMLHDGVDPSTTSISLSGGTADLSALIGGQADYIWLFNGWDGLAANLLGYQLNILMIKDYDQRLDYYSPLFVASNSYIERESKQAAKLMRAISKGYHYAAGYPTEAAEIMMNRLPGLNKNLIMASQHYLASLYLDNDDNFGIMKESVFSEYNSWLVEHGLLTKPPVTSSLYSNELLVQP